MENKDGNKKGSHLMVSISLREKLRPSARREGTVDVRNEKEKVDLGQRKKRKNERASLYSTENSAELFHSREQSE